MMSIIFTLIFLIPVGALSWFIYPIIYLVLFIYSIFSFWFLGFFGSLSYSFGFDLLSFSLVLLSFWILFLMVLSSSESGGGSFLMVLLFLLIFLVLSFSVINLFAFYFFFESTLIPTVLLIFGWGYQPERLSSGFYLLFYTLFASLALLVCIFYCYHSCFTLFYFLVGLDINVWVYLCMVMAFLVKFPMFMFHFWLPKAHVEAPVSGSMVLAAVLLKLGGYGLIRVLYILGPCSLDYNMFFMSLSLFGGLLVGVFCLYQIDIKSLIAYSSVSHMSLVIVGIMTMNSFGLFGGLVLMVGHGLCSSGLFCLANIYYEKTSSRSLLINKGFINFMPSMGLLWFLLCANNMSSPPSFNLLGELLLVNSIMAWNLSSWLYLSFILFFSCCYSIYLYSIIQHGSLGSSLKVLVSPSYREYYLATMHLLPLNLLVLSGDIFALFI